MQGKIKNSCSQGSQTRRVLFLEQGDQIAKVCSAINSAKSLLLQLCSQSSMDLFKPLCTCDCLLYTLDSFYFGFLKLTCACVCG